MRILTFTGDHIMRVVKWGHSLAIRLPVTVVNELGLKAGDDIQVTVRDPRHLEVERMPGAQELLRRLRVHGARLPADWKFDRDDAHAW